MRRYALSSALFMFMERGEKLTFDAIWNDSYGPQNRYVIWPRAQYWDVRFKRVTNGMLEWETIADKPFGSENEAWQAAYADWECKLEKLGWYKRY